MKKNILKEFIKKIILTMVFLSISSISLIYFYEKNKLDNTLATEVTKHIDEGIEGKFGEKGLLKKEFIHHVKMVNFIFFNLYDEEQSKTYHFFQQNTDKFFLKSIKEHISNDKKHSIDNAKTYYEFFEIKDKGYYIHITYPIYKDGILLGYLDGVRSIPKGIIEKFKKQILYTVFIILLTIFIFSLFIYPIIYLAYKELNQNTIKQITNNIMTINTLGNAIALRDSDTNEHNYRVTIYAIKLAKKVGLKDKDIKRLIIGAFLHDVGKIGISDTILLKNAKLSDEEFEIMKEHVYKGIELVKDNNWLEEGSDVILYHHEKYNGSGYPQNIKGENIPLIARIFSIVDVFDALTSKRPYKEAFSYDVAKNIMLESSGSHFDAKLLQTFLYISTTLYKEVRLKSKEKLKQELDDFIYHYFLNIT